MDYVIKRDITGPQIIALIRHAIRAYSTQTGLTATSMDFCRAADISRQQLYLYRRGHAPAREGIEKIAQGLRAWGYTVKINY